MTQDLVNFLASQSDTIRVAMEKNSNGKKKVNHRKYIQKRMKSAQKPKPVFTPASAKVALISKARRIPSFTTKAELAYSTGGDLPSWVDFSSTEKEVVSSSSYLPCDPQVDEVLSAFESSDFQVDSPRSCISDPFSPYSSSTISESGEELTNLDANFGSPSYQSYVEDCGYCSDISQFSPAPKYW